MQQLIFQYRDLNVEVNYKPIKNCYLRVRGDYIEVNSSPRNSRAEIERLLELYYLKLKQKISQIKSVQSFDASSLNLLGINYPILQKCISNKADSIAIIDNICEINFKSSATLEILQSLIQKFYHKSAAKLFPELIQQRFAYFAEQRYLLPKLSIKVMRSRWGSYSKHTHQIHLNLALIQLDVKLIDYVVVHELCHLIEQNHSSRFYALMSNFLPNWRELRNQLNQFSSILH